MRTYLLALGAGLIVGLFYKLIQVRSPAPPVVALVGLLGILVGEQIPSLALAFLRRESAAMAWIHQIKPHMFGELPRGQHPPTRGSDRAEIK